MAHEVWTELAEQQGGVLGRGQLLALGLTPRQARRWLDSRQWRALHPGVYLTVTGPVGDRARVWAAVLAGGRGAAAGHRTALWLGRALDDLPDLLDVCVPADRQPAPLPGVRFHRVNDLAGHLHPAAGGPPRVLLEVAVLDVADQCSAAEQVVDVVLRVIQRRLTTADRLRQQLRSRPRHRWRRLVEAVLADSAEGVASVLEQRYARDVERAHRLPAGARNRAEVTARGRRYRDVRYNGFGTVVELDGREAHPPDEAFRDLRRDNEVVLGSGRTLRYGWRDVAGRPCVVAAQVAGALHDQGWVAMPRRCGPDCAIRVAA